MCRILSQLQFSGNCCTALWLPTHICTHVCTHMCFVVDQCGHPATDMPVSVISWTFRPAQLTTTWSLLRACKAGINERDDYSAMRSTKANKCTGYKCKHIVAAHTCMQQCLRGNFCCRLANSWTHTHTHTYVVICARRCAWLRLNSFS